MEVAIVISTAQSLSYENSYTTSLRWVCIKVRCCLHFNRVSYR